MFILSNGGRRYRTQCGRGTMNLRTFSIFIIVLGIVLLAGGGIQYVQNPPFPGSGRLSTLADEMMENGRRTEKRKSATPIIIGGAIALFLGIAVYSSAKK